MIKYLDLITFIVLVILNIGLLIIVLKTKIANKKHHDYTLVKLNENISKKFSEQRLELIQLMTNHQQTISSFLYTTISTNQELSNQNHQQIFDQINHQLKELQTSIFYLTQTLDQKINLLNQESKNKLDQIKEIVEEKLQTTLNQRLNESYSQVVKGLNQVYHSLGEVQVLAQGVGDLKKVLSGVKTRGILGEIQLGAILEQILTKDQYDQNVITKKASNDRVEYAIKLPNQGSQNIYLPIDAKFPLDVYHHLIEAIDSGDQDNIKIARKNLEINIKKSAKEIKDKYLDVPYTTDFGILFLPFEGLYAEVVNSGIIEIVQWEYKIMLAGPTTTAALINSLQMGFRTLAIQQRSTKVWEILEAVKTQFINFHHILEQTQKQIGQAGLNLEKLIGVRTRSIINKLNQVSTPIINHNDQILIDNDESEE